jgi:hypothetical protein
MHTPLEVYSVPQNIDARSLLLVCFVLNQNVPPKYLARTVLISLGNYPRVFFMQKSAFYSNPSPTFGFDPLKSKKGRTRSGLSIS